MLKITILLCVLYLLSPTTALTREAEDEITKYRERLQSHYAKFQEVIKKKVEQQDAEINNENSKCNEIFSKFNSKYRINELRNTLKEAKEDWRQIIQRRDGFEDRAPKNDFNRCVRVFDEPKRKIEALRKKIHDCTEGTRTVISTLKSYCKKMLDITISTTQKINAQGDARCEPGSCVDPLSCFLSTACIRSAELTVSLFTNNIHPVIEKQLGHIEQQVFNFTEEDIPDCSFKPLVREYKKKMATFDNDVNECFGIQSPRIIYH